MARGNKDKGSETVVEEAAPAPDYSEDAATEGSTLPLPATQGAGSAPMMSQAADPNAEPVDLDPGGDIATDFRTEVVGREIVITRWGLAPAAEQYANANPYGLFAVIGFRFSDDTERKPRFTTTGAQRVVETVHQKLTEGAKLPVKTRVIAFTARGGTGYRFLRPGETVR